MEQLPVVIDCDTCLARSAEACGDCVVSVLLGGPPAMYDDERAALDALAQSGLVPPPRLVRPVGSGDAQQGVG
jgi:hypothetical protein